MGIENTGKSGQAVRLVNLTRGALATSGDSRRFIMKDGVRYSHILDARTGWSVRAQIDGLDRQTSATERVADQVEFHLFKIMNFIGLDSVKMNGTVCCGTIFLNLKSTRMHLPYSRYNAQETRLC